MIIRTSKSYLLKSLAWGGEQRTLANSEISMEFLKARFIKVIRERLDSSSRFFGWMEDAGNFIRWYWLAVLIYGMIGLWTRFGNENTVSFPHAPSLASCHQQTPRAVDVYLVMNQIKLGWLACMAFENNQINLFFSMIEIIMNYLTSSKNSHSLCPGIALKPHL